MDELSLPFDVVVVGAGVNGLGIAQDAALRGLRVALLEQDDICAGVSAWSGRLVHGGLRYLEHRDFALVRESLRERELLFKLAPHLVKPVRLLMPFYSHNRLSPKDGWRVSEELRSRSEGTEFVFRAIHMRLPSPQHEEVVLVDTDGVPL